MKVIKKGEYRWVAEELKHVVFANPENQDARNLQADAFEQIVYQIESAIWRNLYLVGAKELRDTKKPSTDLLKNGVLHYKENKPETEADFTLTLSKQKFVGGLTEPEKFRSIVMGNEVTREGNIFRLRELLEDVEKFNPNWNIVTP